ncbi:uncharacterized protein LOC142350925 [Convolutriloba macropyga]|uniref:uncharacterized protein LOC142350925 n=1 Tax=Convolutriloba macropyga TaxID=536237 RepID=UPI003F51EFF4
MEVKSLKRGYFEDLFYMTFTGLDGHYAIPSYATENYDRMIRTLRELQHESKKVPADFLLKYAFKSRNGPPATLLMHHLKFILEMFELSTGNAIETKYAFELLRLLHIIHLIEYDASGRIGHFPVMRRMHQFLKCFRHLIHEWTAYSAAWATPARIEKYEKFVCDVYHGVYWKRCNVTNYMLPQNQGVICDRYRNKMKEELLANEFNKFIDANY